MHIAADANVLRALQHEIEIYGSGPKSSNPTQPAETAASSDIKASSKASSLDAALLEPLTGSVVDMRMAVSELALLEVSSCALGFRVSFAGCKLVQCARGGIGGKVAVAEGKHKFRCRKMQAAVGRCRQVGVMTSASMCPASRVAREEII